MFVLVNLTFKSFSYSQTIREVNLHLLLTLHQFVAPPTIDVPRPQHQRSDWCFPRRHPITLCCVPPGRARFRLTAHSLSDFRRRVFHRYPTQRDQDHRNKFTLLEPGVIWNKFGPYCGSHLEWRWVRSAGWLGSSNSRLFLRTGVGGPER